jgi:hypothetical protein
MLTLPCLYTVTSAVLFTLPRVVGTAAEFGLNRNTALLVWRICAGRLWLHYSSLLPGSGRIGSRRIDIASGSHVGFHCLIQERR